MTRNLRVVFAGTPEFAAKALAAIHEAGFPVCLVLTQPDRPAGRGMKLSPSPVKQYALTHGMEVDQPPSLRLNGKYPDEAAAAFAKLNALSCDVMVVAAYGLLLPQAVLDLPRHGCINIHASLLPRWRGAAPIHRAIEAGDAESGVTLMQMDAGLDTGAMISVATVPIHGDSTTAMLHDALAEAGAKLIVDALIELEAKGSLASQAQPAEGVTYAEKIAKSEALLDWSRSAAALARQIRAFNPFPGALAYLGDTAVKLWSASEYTAPLPELSTAGDAATAAAATNATNATNATAAAAPGTILFAGSNGIAIACGQGVLLLTECQKPGGKRLPAREFLAGFPLRAGQRFTQTAGVA